MKPMARRITTARALASLRPNIGNSVSTTWMTNHDSAT
jgi:hypothetical protein